MSTHRHFDKLCLVAVLLALLLTLGLANGSALGIQAMAKSLGYENRLFDTSRVHTIDIVMEDWEGFLESCVNEEYTICSVVIDGSAFKNVGIRAKGNTSLSTVARSDSDRYSFKIEFDQYDSGRSYYGLDKICLNNIIQDNTYMKDYLTYQMMGSFGVNAPLCSYAYLTVNGEDWGLYLAVEAMEDGFLQRNYGSDPGMLYKPDSTGGMGGGAPNREKDMPAGQGEGRPEMTGGGEGNLPADPAGSTQPLTDGVAGEETPPQGEGHPEMTGPGEGNLPADPAGSTQPQTDGAAGFQRPDRGQTGRENRGPGGGMGSADVKLQYIDENPDSYPNIFENAKTDSTQKDQARLIASLKDLSEGKNIEQVVAVDEVIRYFVVHNFVCNGDSYTGSIIHNYYLYEKDGRLSMLPWDYNLAFGTFQSSQAGSAVNSPIDTPVSGGTGEDRPMIHWIFADEAYTEQYHQYFAQFLADTDFAVLIEETAALIAPYVEKDPTKFCTYEQFEVGVEALRTFCLLREESVLGQLAGTIPSTSEGQAAEPEALVDASSLTLSDMGNMNMGGRGGMGERPGEEGQARPQQTGGAAAAEKALENAPGAERQNNAPQGETIPLKNGGFPGEPGGQAANAPGGDSPAQTETTGRLLAVSLLVLGVGLWVAFRAKR